MKKSYYLVLILIIAVALLASACGKKEAIEKCEQDSDCAPKTCHSMSCIKEKCVSSAIMNCCGNKIKEAGENECSCPADYGQCAAKSREITYACNEKNECAPTTTAQTFSSEKDTGKFKLQLSTTIDKPFDLKRSVIGFGLELAQADAGVSDVKINKVAIETMMGSSNVLLGEKTFERTLWKAGDRMNDEIIVDYDFGVERAEKLVSLKIFYEYKEKGIVQSSSYTEQIKTPTIFVKSIGQALCPVSCNDNNRCTNDYCSDLTSNFCKRNIILNCNGNWICEADETKCNAPLDCGPCEGNVGSYMQYECFDDDCKTTIKESAQLSKTYPNTKTASYFTLNFDVSIKQPLNIKNDTVKIDFTLSKFDEKNAALPLTVRKVEINDKTIVLGKKTDGLIFPSIGYANSVEIPVSSYEFDGYEKEIYLNIKIDYEFAKMIGGTATPTTESFEQALKEKVTVIKPDVS